MKKSCGATAFIKGITEAVIGLAKRLGDLIKIAEFRNSSYQRLMSWLEPYMIDKTFNRTLAMTRLLNFFHGLFGAASVQGEDHLTGAVDLSDAAYCFDLLAQNDERAI